MNAKCIFDRTVSFLLLVLLIPTFIIITLLIIVSFNGSIIFVQSRIGRNGKPFRMYKFRTMYPNSGPSISIKNDPRITPIGRFLRKWKIDELPELWNVLIGDMSFVGPRPDVPGYADKLKGEEELILTIKPGITSPASLKYLDEEELLSKVDDPISYNDEVIFPDKVKINLKYFKKRNLVLDMKVIFFTIMRKKDFIF